MNVYQAECLKDKYDHISHSSMYCPKALQGYVEKFVFKNESNGLYTCRLNWFFFIEIP